MTTTHPASSLHTDVTVLKQLTAIRLDVAIWTARKKLSAADFGNAGLPPEKLASLGSKRVCNPEDLRIFAALKARAVALLERTGVRFLDGWAIPEAKTYTAVQELSRIGTAFGDAKAAFLARYDETIRQWIADNPGWESLIAGSTVGVEGGATRLPGLKPSQYHGCITSILLLRLATSFNTSAKPDSISGRLAPIAGGRKQATPFRPSHQPIRIL